MPILWRLESLFDDFCVSVASTRLKSRRKCFRINMYGWALQVLILEELPPALGVAKVGCRRSMSYSDSGGLSMGARTSRAESASSWRTRSLKPAPDHARW